MSEYNEIDSLANNFANITLNEKIIKKRNQSEEPENTDDNLNQNIENNENLILVRNFKMIKKIKISDVNECIRNILNKKKGYSINKFWEEKGSEESDYSFLTFVLKVTSDQDFNKLLTANTWPVDCEIVKFRYDSERSQEVFDLEKPMNDKLSIYYQNVGGLCTKSEELFKNLKRSIKEGKTTYDIICLSETNFTYKQNTCEYFPSDYMVFKKNCQNGDRGVLIALVSALNPRRIVISDSDTSLEYVCCSFSYNKKRIFIYNLYISPNLNKKKNRKLTKKQTYDGHFNNLRKLTLGFKKSDELIVMGDFNLPDLKWIASTRHGNTLCLTTKYSQNQYQSLLNSTMDSSKLSQINYVQNEGNVILDLVYLNSNLFASLEKINKPLVNMVRHHPPLGIYIKF